MLTLKPKPTQHVGAQALLQSDSTHCGWLRRRKKFLNKFRGVPWMKFFVVLHGGSLYCFWDERAKAPWAAFSLYGFNRVLRATEIPASEAPWCFKLEHLDTKVSHKYFSASSPNDLKDWMKVIKSEMERVNKKAQRESRDDSDDDHYSDIEEPIYQTTDTVDKELYDSFEEDSGEELIYPEPDENYIEVVPETEVRTSTQSGAGAEGLDSSTTPTTPGNPTTPSTPGTGSSTPTTPGTPETERRDNKMKGVGKFFKGIPGRLKALKKNMGGKSASSPQSPEMRTKSSGSSHRRSDACSSDISSDSQRSNDTSSNATTAEEAKEESTSYWSKIWFNDNDQTEAYKLISDLGVEGVFLVRKHGDPATSAVPYVLIVQAEAHTRKYKINRDQQTEELYISQLYKFQSVEDLLYHYFSNPLPNTAESTLLEPYYIHVQSAS